MATPPGTPPPPESSDPRRRRRRMRANGGGVTSLEWVIALEVDHVIGLASIAAWRMIANGFKNGGGLHATAGWLAETAGGHARLLPSAASVEGVVLGGFVVVPALASAALRAYRKRVYMAELTAFYTQVDPTELTLRKVATTADKLARLGPRAPAARKKHYQTLARRYGVSPDKVAAEALASGRPVPLLPGTPPAHQPHPPPQKVRWGILGTANIARKNVVSMSLAKNAVCIAVASRSKPRAEKYAAENGNIPKAYGSYEDLLADPEIDAVYIPLPTSVRKEWVLKAAAAGKHVLAEKPVGGTLADVQEMVEACAKNRVLLMDGVMFMHHTRLKDVRALLSTSILGETIPSRMNACFSFAGDPAFFGKDIRVDDREPLGCLGDLGWYTVRFALWLHRYALPNRVMMTTHRKSPAGVPTDCSCTLEFGGSKTVTFDVSFHHTLRQWVELAGPSATLTIPDFVIPQSTTEATCVVERWGATSKALTFRREKREVLVTKGCNQHARMIENFSQLVTAGDVDAYTEWSAMVLSTQKVLDALMASSHMDGEWVSL